MEEKGKWLHRKLKAETQLKEAQHKLADYELQIQAKEWISVKEVKEQQSKMCAEIRKQLDFIPTSYADSFINITSVSESKKILQKIVDDLLVRLHEGK